MRRYLTVIAKVRDLLLHLTRGEAIVPTRRVRDLLNRFREWRRRRRTIYSCGNCRERFKSRDEQRAHLERGCPQVAMEREVAEHNRRAREYLEL